MVERIGLLRLDVVVQVGVEEGQRLGCLGICSAPGESQSPQHGDKMRFHGITSVGQSLNFGSRFARVAAMVSVRSSDISMAAFQVAT